MKDNPFDPQNNLRKALEPVQEIINEATSPALKRIYDSHFEQHRGIYSEIMENFNPSRSVSVQPFSPFDYEQFTSSLNKRMWDTVLGRGASGVTVSEFMKRWEGAGASAVSQAMRGINISELANPASDHAPALFAQIYAGARINELMKGLSETVHSQIGIYEPVIEKLNRTLDFYQPASLEKAVSLVKANPEVVEATRELIEEHPEEAQEVASKVSSDDNRDSSLGSAHSNAAIALPWLGAFNDISAATFNSTTGASLAYTAFTSLLLAILTSWVISLEQNKNSPKQIDPPEEK